MSVNLAVLNFNDAVSTLDQKVFVESLLDNGVSSEIIASALPTHTAASLVGRGGGISVESYRNELHGSSCINSIIEYDAYSAVTEAFLPIIDSVFDSRGSLEDLQSSADTLKDKVSDAIDKLKEKLANLKAWAAEKAKLGSDYAKEHPYKAAATIMGIIAASTAALILCKFLMKRNSDIKSAYKDLSEAKSAFEQSFAKNAEDLAKHGMTPEGVGMAKGTKGSAAAFTKDTMYSNVNYPGPSYGNRRTVNVSELQRKIDALWPKLRENKDKIDKLVLDGQSSSEAAQKLRDIYNADFRELVRAQNAQAAHPGDRVYTAMNEIKGSRVTWDYTTLGKKIDEATESLDKLKNVFGSAKEFIHSLTSGLSPISKGNTDTFSPGRLIVVWKVSVYGTVAALIGGLLNKISSNIHTPEK